MTTMFKTKELENAYNNTIPSIRFESLIDKAVDKVIAKSAEDIVNNYTKALQQFKRSGKAIDESLERNFIAFVCNSGFNAIERYLDNVSESKNHREAGIHTNPHLEFVHAHRRALNEFVNHDEKIDNLLASESKLVFDKQGRLKRIYLDKSAGKTVKEVQEMSEGSIVYDEVWIALHEMIDGAKKIDDDFFTKKFDYKTSPRKYLEVKTTSTDGSMEYASIVESGGRKIKTSRLNMLIQTVRNCIDAERGFRSKTDMILFVDKDFCSRVLDNFGVELSTQELNAVSTIFAGYSLANAAKRLTIIRRKSIKKGTVKTLIDRARAKIIASGILDAYDSTVFDKVIDPDTNKAIRDENGALVKKAQKKTFYRFTKAAKSEIARMHCIEDAE